MVMKTSCKKWIGIPSMDLYCNQPKSLILSNASELVWSWICKNHIQVTKEKKSLHFACSCLSYSVKLGIFMSWKRIRGQRIYKKVWCNMQSCCLTYSTCCYFDIPVAVVIMASLISLNDKHVRISSRDSKVRAHLQTTLNNTTRKYCSVGFYTLEWSPFRISFRDWKFRTTLGDVINSTVPQECMAH